MADINGATIIARSLKAQGVEFIFGIGGFPVIPIPFAAQAEGIRYIGMRNEQAASYAAAAVGYLTGRPGACLVVSGPGVVHGIAGMANAWSNCWPMILLGGSCSTYQEGMGAFQEAPQLETAQPYAKYAARPDRLDRLPFYVEQAVRTSIQGRPGAVYLDLPDDIIAGSIDEDAVKWMPPCPDPQRPEADPADVSRAIDVLRKAERPLVIVGKGAAYSRAEAEVRSFIDATQIPFLPTPMGKGVMPDDHPLSVAPGRSFALQNADVVLTLGARLNWILHFGLPPRFHEDVKVIQVDIHGEEIGTNVPAEVGLVGDARAVIAQLSAAIRSEPITVAADTPWRKELGIKIEENQLAVQAMMDDDSAPMGYYRVLREIHDLSPRDSIICAEGANTMDISRTVLHNYEARHRLDAGTFGTMGVGLGQAIAAAVVHPDKKVVCVEGDSAFGFSGMEVETACRYRLPITFVVINNNGIGQGYEDLGDDPANSPPLAYTIDARYERVIEGFGGKGYCVRTPDELGSVLKEALADPMPNVVNVLIDPKASRKPQKFTWLTQ